MKDRNSKNKSSLFWFPLDNAAKIFPAIRSGEHTTVIRISVLLKERIAIKPLMKAVELASRRFPYYRVSLHHGMFWYYLQESKEPFKMVPDTGPACQAFRSNHLVRVLAYKNRLSAEISHILTDGYGVSQFLLWIIEHYYKIKNGEPIDSDHINPDPEILKEEKEDAYSRYFKDDVPLVKRLSKAYHLPFELSEKPRFDALVAILNMNEIKALAKEKQITITEYIVSALLMVLQEIAQKYNKRKKGIIRVQVPVNLRNIYPSQSMRNFSLFVMLEIDTRLGHYTFDEITKVVYHKMRLETDEKLISKIVSRNVGGEKKLIIRSIPLFIKNMFLRYKFYSEGANQYTCVVTNLGKVSMSEDIKQHVEYMVFTPPPPNKKLKVNFGVLGINDKLVISMGNITKSKEVEKNFIRFLTRQGVHIQLKKLMEL